MTPEETHLSQLAAQRPLRQPNQPLVISVANAVVARKPPQVEVSKERTLLFHIFCIKHVRKEDKERKMREKSFLGLHPNDGQRCYSQEEHIFQYKLQNFTKLQFCLLF